MFQRRLGRTALDVKHIKFIQFPFIRLESGEPWLRENATMSRRRRVTVDRSILFNGSLPRLLRSRL